MSLKKNNSLPLVVRTNHELFKLNSSERFFLGNLIEVQPSERHNPLIEHWISDKANDSTFQDYVVKKKIVKSVHGNVTIRVNKRLLHVFLIMMSLNSLAKSKSQKLSFASFWTVEWKN